MCKFSFYFGNLRSYRSQFYLMGSWSCGYMMNWTTWVSVTVLWAQIIAANRQINTIVPMFQRDLDKINRLIVFFKLVDSLFLLAFAMWCMKNGYRIIYIIPWFLAFRCLRLERINKKTFRNFNFNKLLLFANDRYKVCIIRVYGNFHNFGHQTFDKDVFSTFLARHLSRTHTTSVIKLIIFFERNI